MVAATGPVAERKSWMDRARTCRAAGADQVAATGPVAERKPGADRKRTRRAARPYRNSARACRKSWANRSGVKNPDRRSAASRWLRPSSGVAFR